MEEILGYPLSIKFLYPSFYFFIMATLQEIVDYINDLAATQGVDGKAYPSGTDVILLRIDGTYTDNQLDHIINRYDEISGFSISAGLGYLNVMYNYEEVVP